MFSVNLLVISHFLTSARSSLMILVSVIMSLLDVNRVVSSAKRMDFMFLVNKGKSYMYIRNNRGPRTEPCGTPMLISFVFDLYSLTVTNWCLFER